jgi:hypothetical protein
MFLRSDGAQRVLMRRSARHYRFSRKARPCATVVHPDVNSVRAGCELLTARTEIPAITGVLVHVTARARGVPRSAGHTAGGQCSRDLYTERPARNVPVLVDPTNLGHCE